MKTKILRLLFIGSILTSLSLGASLEVKAQQDPMYTQYMFNTQIINPAYTGSWESMGFLALGRQMWVGFEGAPETFTFSFQSPFKQSRKAAFGINVMTDKVGREELFALNADYSYMLRVGQTSKLRLGLKAGLTNYSNPLTEYMINEGDDWAFRENFESEIMYNFGLGAFLYDDRYYVGLSAPKLVNNYLTTGHDFVSEVQLRHYFLMAGYVFRLSRDVDFKPSMLTKVVSGAPVQFDLSANFLIKEKLWLGAMYRTHDAYGFVAQWIFNERLRIGYAMDFALTDMRFHSSYSHEIMISYEIKFQRNQYASPRYF